MPATDPAVGVAVRPQVLIVDDSPGNLGVLQGVLEEKGFYVLVATSGERALAGLADTPPDLILMDVNMPGLNGYETCRRLKADARWGDVPVLFLTARDDSVDKLRGFEAGGVDYITKPLDPEEVLARVRAHLQIRSLQNALAEKNRLLEFNMAKRLEAEAQLRQSLDRAVVLVDMNGEVVFCTRLAQRLLERYFPGHADATTLPPPLTDWLAGVPQTGRWSAEGSEGRLEVRRFAPDDDAGAYVVLVLEEKTAVAGSPEPLLHLGLTMSEAEVLYWAAHGKSNHEVAIILDKTLNTVKKHTANLIEKMGVETRPMAALQAAEVFELRVIDPEKLLAIREKYKR